MKNDVQFGVRMPRELRDQWNETCETAGQDSAAVARELFKAAIRYYERNKNLYAPFELVPGARTDEERTTFMASSVNQVVNGHHNHVAARIRKIKKP